MCLGLALVGHWWLHRWVSFRRDLGGGNRVVERVTCIDLHHYFTQLKTVAQHISTLFSCCFLLSWTDRATGQVEATKAYAKSKALLTDPSKRGISGSDRTVMQGAEWFYSPDMPKYWLDTVTSTTLSRCSTISDSPLAVHEAFHGKVKMLQMWKPWSLPRFPTQIFWLAIRAAALRTG